MKASDALAFTVDNLASRPLRSGLSTLGMMFGVAAVIAMLAIGAGAERRALALIERLGVHNVLIRARTIPPAERAEARKKSMGLTMRDVQAIGDAVPHVVMVAPKAKIDAYKVIGGGLKAEAKIWGVTHHHPEAIKLALEEGRFFDEREVTGHAQVAVMGPGLRRDLFATEAALDQAVKVNDVWFHVVGVLAEDPGVEGVPGVAAAGNDQDLYVPLTPLLAKFDRDPLDSPLEELVVQLDGKASSHESAAVMKGLLR